MNLPVEAIQWTYQPSEWTSVRIGFVSCKVCLLVMFCSIQYFPWKLVRHQNILFAESWDPGRATNEAPSISYTVWRPHMRKRTNATQTPISRGYHGYKRNAETPPAGISLLSACVYKTWRRGVRRRLTTCRHDQSDAQGTHWRKLDDSCQKIVNASSVKNTCKRGFYLVERSGSVWGMPHSEDWGAERIRKSVLYFQYYFKGQKREESQTSGRGRKSH